jgi:ketohexokinase
MAKILAVGIATLDIINTVARYPLEDSEIRAVSQQKTRGGNATNTLAVLSQLGHQCHWAGVLVDETDTQLIRHDLAQYNIDIHACQQAENGKMPTSYITLDQHTGSRTIVHFRDCPEYSFSSFKALELTAYDWIHFEGRNITQTRLMIQYLKQHHPDIPCSLEIEKSRPDITSLFDLTDVLLFSKDYVIAQGTQDPTDFLQGLKKPHATLASCTWGNQGAWLIDASEIIHHAASPNEGHIIDTLAAGDTFNAGLIHSLSIKKPPRQALDYAVQLANHKCQQSGIADLTHTFNYKEQ